MSFLAPLFFVALAGLAIPVLLHLTQREKKQIVHFPSLMFVRRIPYQSVRRRKIHNWLLLFVRLAALALMGLDDINRMNAVKVFLAAMINGVAVAVFAFSGTVQWQFAGAMAVAAAVGGFCGAHYGRRIPREIVRWIVIAIGFALAVHYFVHQRSS